MGMHPVAGEPDTLIPQVFTVTLLAHLHRRIAVQLINHVPRNSTPENARGTPCPLMDASSQPPHAFCSILAAPHKSVDKIALANGLGTSFQALLQAYI